MQTFFPRVIEHIRFMLAEEYYRLKDEVRSMEVLRQGMKELMLKDAPCKQQRVQSASLR